MDAEVMRLSRLRAEHGESQFSLRNRLRRGEEEIKRLERERAAVEKDRAMVQDTSGDRFEILLDGKVYTDRAKAGAALIYFAQEHSTDHLVGRQGSVILGEFAGFRMEFRSTLAEKVTLRGASDYVATISPSPVGTISSLEHAARSVHDQAARLQQHLDEIRKSNESTAMLVGKVFEHEEHYWNLIKRQGDTLVGYMSCIEKLPALTIGDFSPTSPTGRMKRVFLGGKWA